MASIISLPVQGTPSVGGASNKPQASVALVGLRLDLARGDRLEALLRNSGSDANGFTLTVAGNPSIAIDAKLAQAFVPAGAQSAKLQFQILRQLENGAVEVRLLSALVDDAALGAPASELPAAQSLISSAARALDSAARSQEALGSSPALSTRLIDAPPQAASASAVLLPQLAADLARGLANIIKSEGIGYERALARWSDLGASAEGAQAIKASYPQAQADPRHIALLPSGEMAPSALSVGRQAQALESGQAQWNGSLWPGANAQALLGKGAPPAGWDRMLSDPEEPNARAQSGASEAQASGWLSMKLDLPALGQARLWAVWGLGRGSARIVFAQADSARLARELAPNFEQALSGARMRLSIEQGELADPLGESA